MPDCKVSLWLRSDADFPYICLGESLVFSIYEEAPFQLPSWTVVLSIATLLAKVLMRLRVARYPNSRGVLWAVWQLSWFYICNAQAIAFPCFTYLLGMLESATGQVVSGVTIFNSSVLAVETG